MSLTRQQAHNISAVRYLSSNGIFPVYSSRNWQEYHYHSPIRRGDSTPSFHLNVVKNKRHDKGLDHGGDVIDLVAEHQCLTRSQACHWLSQSGLYCGDYVPEFPSVVGRAYRPTHRRNTPRVTAHAGNHRHYAELEADTSFLIETIQPVQHPVLLQYLAYRCIDSEIAGRYGLKEINYRLIHHPDSAYFSLAWFNDSGGCEFNSRAGARSFKGCLWIKDVTCINPTPWAKVALFESALDFRAYLSFFGIREFQNTALILNSVSQRRKVLPSLELLTPSEIHLFLDNDSEGMQATESLLTELHGRFLAYNQAGLYEGHKDMNAMVMAKTATRDRKS